MENIHTHISGGFFLNLKKIIQTKNIFDIYIFVVSFKTL